MLSYTFQLYKKAYSGLSHNSWYLSLIMLINRMGTMVVPFMTIYCTQQLHFTIAQAGIIMALFGAGSIAGAFVGGKITDRFGFYEVQIGALLSGGLLFILLGYQHSFISVAIVTFILSLCNEALRPANATAVAYYSNDKNRTRSHSLNRLAINLGWACGGALGGFLASANYHLLFWIDGCTNILSAVMLLALMSRPQKRTQRSQQTSPTDITSSAYKDGIYLAFIALTILFATAFFQLFTMQPVFYKAEWHLNEKVIGFLMSLNGLLIIAFEMILIHKLQGKRHAMNYISLGILLTGIAFIVLNLLPPNIWAAIMVVIFITLGEMLSMPFMNYFWVIRTNESNRGQYAALYTMAWSTAQVIAPAIGSAVILHGGFHMLWWILGAGCFVASIGFIWLYQFAFRERSVLAVQ